MGTRFQKPLAPRPGITELRLKTFLQSPGMSGPASLKIACAYFGKEITEQRLAESSGATAEEHVGHANLIKAAQVIGATVHEMKDATIADIRRFVHERHLPVIVGWQSPVIPGLTLHGGGKKPEKHYSVVSMITDSNVHMFDPNVRTGRRRIPRREFLDLWWDRETPTGPKSKRWLMAIEIPKK
jgi:ABC-type bacteriocin/lantibiotic exporter with double-glycine peptidase domain